MIPAGKMDDVSALLEQLRDRFVFLIYRILLEFSPFAAVGYDAFIPHVPAVTDDEINRNYLASVNALVAELISVSSRLRDLDNAMYALKFHFSSDDIRHCE
ncbi:hypothetical protein LSM04_004068 [Trypanosoma melophagium]|uniref:uncharacterized protein n=1 Tax=Trypanosoma melophagium TaxID=715481 RepID=UPI00351A07A7|nr:hypothetical protein LSM04_004068 [Trypanosoma melophagium]